MTGQQMCFPTVILPKRCRTPGQRGRPLKYLVTREYNCLFPWNMSLETQTAPRDSGPDYRVYHWNSTLLDQAQLSTPDDSWLDSSMKDPK